MKAYIAGKITGDPNYYERFQAAKRHLEEEGYIVLNPAELPVKMMPADYMRICFAMMESADLVVFLPDWAKSRGAKIENEWCQYVGKQIMYLRRPLGTGNHDQG